MFITIFKNKNVKNDGKGNVIECKELSEVRQYLIGSKIKQDSIIWNLTKSPTRGNTQIVSGFLIDYDSKVPPLMTTTYSYYLHKTHQGKYRIIIPFATNTNYNEIKDTTDNFQVMIKNIIEDDIEELIRNRVLQKTTFKLKWYSFGIPKDEELIFIKNKTLFDIPLYYRYKHKQVSSKPFFFKPKRYTKEYNILYVMERVYFFIMFYSEKLNWAPIDSKGQCYFNYHDEAKSGAMFNNPSDRYPANIHCKHASCETRLNSEFKMLHNVVGGYARDREVEIPSCNQFNRTMKYLILCIVQGDRTGLCLESLDACIFYNQVSLFDRIHYLTRLKYNATNDSELWCKFFLILKDPKNLKLHLYNKRFYEYVSPELLKDKINNFVVGYHQYKQSSFSSTKKLTSYAYAKNVLSCIGQPSMYLFNTLKHIDCFNVENGLIILDKHSGGFHLIPHTHEVYSTESVKFRYEPEAKCPLWEEALSYYFKNDEHSKKVLQMYFGYCLTFDRSFQKFLLLFGEPNTGKTTICNVMMEVFSCTCVSLLTLLNTDNRTQAMYRKRALVVEEIPKVRDARMMDFIKMVTPNTPIEFRRKYEDSYSSDKVAKLIFTCNEIPHTFDIDAAIKKRMLIIEFKNKIRRTKDNVDFVRLLRKNKEFAGILNWALAGFKELYSTKLFANNDFLADQTYKYGSKEMRIVNEFITYVKNDTKHICVSSSDLYNMFKKHNPKSRMTRQRFALCMTELGIFKRRKADAMYYHFD